MKKSDEFEVIIDCRCDDLTKSHASVDDLDGVWNEKIEQSSPFKITEELKQFLHDTLDIYFCMDYLFRNKKDAKFRVFENPLYNKEDITEEDFLQIIKVFCKRFKDKYNRINRKDNDYFCHWFSDYYIEGIICKKSKLFHLDGYMYFYIGS